GELSLRRREAHVDHVEALLDGPAQSREQNRSGTGEPGAEHTDAVELAFGREPVDDARAGRAVSAEIPFLVRADDRLAVLADRHRDRVCDRADLRMIRLDPAVEHTDTDAFPGRPAERPLTRDHGPVVFDADAFRR